MPQDDGTAPDSGSPSQTYDGGAGDDVEFIKMIPGRKHLCLGEGAQSTWLGQILSPHVDEIGVAHLERDRRARNDDETDAFAQAEDLRARHVKPVFKDSG
jgi:hypothetical protein